MNEADPFEATSDVGTEPIAAARVAPRRRPTGLTVICVLALVLGCMGLLATLVAGVQLGVQLAVGAQFQQSLPSPEAPNADFEQIQREMQTKIQAVTRRFIAPQVVLLVAKFALCAALIYAAVRTLNLRASARRQLAWIFAFLIAFEIIQLSVFVAMQLQIQPIMMEYLSKMMRPADGGTGPPAEAGQLFASVAIIAGLVFAAVWAFAKILFCVMARRYLGKPEIRSLFESPAGSAAI